MNLTEDYYIYYSGQDSPRRNGVAIIVNKRVWNAYSLKKDKMISVVSKAKLTSQLPKCMPQPLTHAEKAEVEQFCEDQHFKSQWTKKDRDGWI